MSSETSQNVSNSVFAKSVNATPFVPGTASVLGSHANKGLQSITSSELVKAAPFVPGITRFHLNNRHYARKLNSSSIVGTLKPSSSEPANNQKINKLVNAAPFVPRR
jgi:hypothetical protein